MYEYITVEKKGTVATITLNRPEVGNAFAVTEYDEVRLAVEDCGSDPAVRVVVITGAGKNFSAGGDIHRFQQNIASGDYIKRENVLRAGGMTHAVRLCPKPVVAVVNGAAAGAGCALALACDFRILTARSKLAMAFINMGFSGDTGGIYFLERMVGIAKATELMTLGTPVDGEEALRLGLATRLAQEGALETAAAEFVALLATKPTQAIARQKRLYYEFFYRDLTQFTQREADFMYETARTEDHQEAVSAFLEKRSPQFTGK